MNILITNDDGIHAQGLQVLKKVLSDNYSVYAIAPNNERSGCSNAIQIRKTIKVEQIDEFTYAVDGFTADCVNIGLHGGLIPPVDIVISGINHGPNLGDDVYFSGTVAGARTAYIFGVSGIALSIDSYEESDYFHDASLFLLELLKDFPLHVKEPLFLNINYPDMPRSAIKGMQYTRLGKRFYRDSYRITQNKNNCFDMELDGTIENDEKTGSDVTELRNGYIVVTPLTIDCTDYDFMNRLKKREITDHIWKN
ncbi:MAG: 5'/3'-nucleotidase SurE [Spirochaetota bacterium]